MHFFTMYYALCTMHYALCTIYYALCIMHYALCTMHYALCTMHYLLFIRIHTYSLFYTYSYVFTISRDEIPKFRYLRVALDAYSNFDNMSEITRLVERRRSEKN